MESAAVAFALVFLAGLALADVGLRRKWWRNGREDDTALYCLVLLAADVFGVAAVVAAFAAA